MKVQIVNKSAYPTPAYATEKSAGMDLKANIDEPVTLDPSAIDDTLEYSLDITIFRSPVSVLSSASPTLGQPAQIRFLLSRNRQLI
mgnify:CR=1 FL=1